MGELPRELQTILQEGGAQNPKVAPTNLFIESGEQSLISISEPVSQVGKLMLRRCAYGEPRCGSSVRRKAPFVRNSSTRAAVYAADSSKPMFAASP